MLLLIAIPILTFYFLYRFFLHTSPNARDAFLKAALIQTAIQIILTEILSLFHWFSFKPILVSWILFLILTWIIQKQNTKPFSYPINISSIKDLNFLEKVLFVSISSIIFILAILAFITPPNTWDSMTYHMSRVGHWIQNHSVMYYPTNIIRQINCPPGAEYIIAHWQLLTNSDHFAPLVQWFSMIGSLIGISLITKSLKASRFGQILSVFIACIIPMGILQSTTTQNDYVVSFWLICFIYFIFKYQESNKLSHCLYIGLSLGLALFTKGTAYLFMIPFLFMLPIKNKINQTVKALTSILLLVLIVNIGYFARNVSFYHNVLPKVDNLTINLSDINWGSFTSNIIRNVGVHLTTPFEKSNTFVEDSVENIHSFFNLDSTNLKTSFGSHPLKLKYEIHQDITGNGIHIILIILTSLLFLFRKQLRNDKYINKYWLLLIALITLFNLLMKWQPWNSRLQLPIFLISAPFIGIILEKTFKQKTLLFCSLLLILLSFPMLFNNSSKPILPLKSNIFEKVREERYFIKGNFYYKDFMKIIKYIKDSECHDIGLWTSEDGLEYPFWAFLNIGGKTPVTIQHIFITNPSKNLKPKIKSSPCLIIQTYNNNATYQIEYEGIPFSKVVNTSYFTLFEHDPNQKILHHSSLQYLKKTIESVNQTTLFFIQNNAQLNISNQNREIISRLKMELDDAFAISPLALENIQQGLGESLESTLLKGLQLRLFAYISNNPQEFQMGQALIIQWLKLMQNNPLPLPD